MTYLNQLMRAQRLTKAELSRQSGIPETTLRDLLSGSVRLENCKAGTILRLARAFHVSVPYETKQGEKRCYFAQYAECKM